MDIWECISRADVEGIESYFKEGGSLDIKNKEGQSLLYAAVLENQKEVVCTLLNNGITYTESYFDGKSPMFAAVTISSIPIIEYLVKDGHSILNITSEDDSILHIACSQNKIELATWILESKLVEIEQRNILGDTPLLQAVKAGSVDSFYLLCRYGADLQARNHQFDSIAGQAVLGGHLEMVQTVYQHYSALFYESNSNEELPLNLAVKEGYLDIVKYILDEGFDVNYSSSTKLTALKTAAKYGDITIFNFLIEKGARYRLPHDTKSVISFAAQYGNIEIINALNTLDSTLKEYGFMEDAAIGNKIESIQWGINNGLTMNVSYPNCPVLLAASHGSLDVIKYTFENNLPYYGKNGNGDTVLLCAVSGGQLETVQWLLENGSSIEEKNDMGMTPLLMAASIGNVELLEYLIQHNADITVHNIQGENALLIAANNEHIEAIFYLLSNGISIENEELLKIAEEKGFLDKVQNEIRNRTKKRVNIK